MLSLFDFLFLCESLTGPCPAPGKRMNLTGATPACCIALKCSHPCSVGTFVSRVPNMIRVGVFIVCILNRGDFSM